MLGLLLRAGGRRRRWRRSIPSNGEIVALASTQRYSASSQFNFAAQAHRQPGSSFKVVRPDDGDQAGHRPRLDLLQRQLADDADDSRAASTVDGQQRRARARHDVAHAGDLGLGQRRSSRSSALDVGRPPTSPRPPTTMGITSPLGIKGARDIPCKARPALLHPPAAAIGGLSVGRHPAGAGQCLRHARQRRRPSPTRPRSTRVVFPEREGRRAERAARASACSPRGRPTRSRKRPRGRDHERHRRRLHVHRLPRGGRQDRHQRGTIGRLVRRLHAALLDRRLDRAPALAQPTPGSAARPPGRSGAPTWRPPRAATAPTSRFPRACRP